MKDPRTDAKWRHDLKNQLGIIAGFSELLIAEMSPEDRNRRDIQEIHTAARRALALMAEISPADTSTDE